MARRIVVALFVCSLVVTLGCGTGRFVQRGIDRYNVADLNGAMREWENVETIEDDLNAKGRVRYLVYRGLTHYERGERDAALYFLGHGRLAYDRGDMAWLPPNITAKMNYALADLTGYFAPRPAPVMAPPPATTVPAR